MIHAINEPSSFCALNFLLIYNLATLLAQGTIYLLTCSKHNSFKAGVPNPGLSTDTSAQPVRNQASQQEVSGGRASEASSVAPHCSPSLALPPESSPARSPPPSMEKLSSTKPVPVPKRLGTAALNNKLRVISNCREDGF